MKNKKIIFAIILFLFIGLTVFTFANPAENEILDGNGSGESMNNGGNTSQNNSTTNNTTNETEKNPTADTNTNNTDGNSQIVAGLPNTNGNGNSGYTPGGNLNGNTGNNSSQSGNTGDNSSNTPEDNTPGSDEDDLYNKALAAVKKAEESKLQTDVDAAKALVDALSENKEELLARLNAVQAYIDAEAILAKLETDLKAASERNDIVAVKDYRDESLLTDLLSAITDESLKDAMTERLNNVSKIVDDSSAPSIEGITDGTHTKDSVKITATDDNKLVATLNGNAYELGTEITEEGEYTVVVKDAAYNETTITFTIDKTAPKLNGYPESGFTENDFKIDVDEDHLESITISKRGEDGATTVENGYVITEEGSYIIEIKDKAGNTLRVNLGVDKAAPVITGVENGKVYNTSVTPVIEDLQLAGSAMLNGQKYASGTEITEEGEYTLVATDRVGHTTTVTFTIDKTAPEVVTFGVLNIANYPENKNYSYIKNDETARVLLYFDEKLAVEPTVTVNGKDFKATYREASSKEGSYAYYADIKITEDLGLAQGEIALTVKSYADEAGNIGKELDNSSINSNQYKSLIYDTVIPTFNFNNGNTFSNKEIIVTDDNFEKMDIYSYGTKETVTVTESNWTLNSGNCMYKLTAYDKAGNKKEIWVYHDDSIPSFTGTGKVSGEEVSFKEGGIYQSLKLTVSDNDIISVKRIYEDGSEDVLASYTWDTNPETVDLDFTEEGSYKLVATDRANNSVETTFVIDKTAAKIAYMSYRVSGDDASNDVVEYWAKDGDKLRVSISSNEKLLVDPTVTFTDSEGNTFEYKNSLKFDFINNIGQYIYTFEYDVTAEMSEGSITPVVSDIKDMAGNDTEAKGDVLYGKVIYIDRTAPSAGSKANPLYILSLHDANYRTYISNGKTLRVEVNYDEMLDTIPVLTIGEGQTVEFRYRNNVDGKYTYVADIVIDNTVAKLESGKVIPFTVTNAFDKAGNEVILNNDNVTTYKVNDVIVYDQVIYDETAPTITVSNGTVGIDPYSKLNLKLYDASGVAKIVINGKELVHKGTYVDINDGDAYKFVEGENTVVVTDKAGNVTTQTFVVDRTPATRVYSTLDFEASGKNFYEEDGKKVYYVKTGDTFKFRMQFSEELQTPPTVTIGGKNVEMNILKYPLEKQGLYVYEGSVTITAEDNMSEGILDVIVSNVVDRAGNISTEEVVTKQTPTSNARVAKYDKTPATITVAGGTVGENPYSKLNLKLHDANSIVKVVINDKELAQKGEYVDINDGHAYSFKEGENTVVVTDKAGNVTTQTFVVDRTAPTFDFSKVPSTYERGYDVYSYPEAGIVKDNIDADRNFSGVNMNWYKKNEDGTKGEATKCFGWDNWNTTLNNCELGDYIITYSITDKAGNKASTERTVSVVDTTAPAPKAFYYTGYDQVETGKQVKYVRKGSLVRVYLKFDEELKNLPKVSINGVDKTFSKDAVWYDPANNNYVYHADYTVEDTTTWEEGLIQVVVTGVSDLQGNVSEDLTNADFVETNGRDEVYYYDTQDKVVATIGEHVYDSLYDALRAARDGETIRVLEDSSVLSPVGFNYDITLDLNGHTLNLGSNAFFQIQNGGSLNVTGKGTINSTMENYAAFTMLASANSADTDYIGLTIGKDVTVVANNGLYIFQAPNTSVGYGVHVTIEGTIKAQTVGSTTAGFGLYVQGMIKNETGYPIINLTNTAKIISEGFGIYAAGNAEWNIDGAYIEGIDAGVAIKSGTLNVTAGTIKATGVDDTPTDGYGNGVNSSGTALQIESHTGYASNMNINISGGTFESKNSAALYEYVGKGTETQVSSIIIRGGTFISGGTRTSLLASEAFNNKFNSFISGGKFSTDPSSYLLDGYSALQNGNGYFTVVKAN